MSSGTGDYGTRGKTGHVPRRDREANLTHKIAVIAGDGIGKEVVGEARRVLERAGEIWGFSFRWSEFDWSCERYLETGRMMPEEGLERLGQHEAIFDPPNNFGDVVGRKD